ncbi:hypothetical protein L6452_38627 [Arctium lappa]|uniref:Uncharacterized protein n=1 Tax=Arctium lappa TaxID=4217 RepID=A0ACB8XQI8_ARCLA|nr:hypothetical protein L6452_38627 [Arctium lappa]
MVVPAQLTAEAVNQLREGIFFNFESRGSKGRSQKNLNPNQESEELQAKMVFYFKTRPEAEELIECGFPEDMWYPYTGSKKDEKAKLSLLMSMLLYGTHVPTRIYAPAAAKDFAIAQPYPLSSATPTINALLPSHKNLN